MYSMSSLTQYEPFVDSVNATFLNKLRQFAETGKSFDLFTWMQFYAFDVIGEITIGQAFGMLDTGSDEKGILSAIHFVNGVHGARLGHLPELHNPVVWLAKIFRLKNPMDSINAAVNDEIALRKSGVKAVDDRQDFLNKCMDLQSRDKLDQFGTFNVLAQNVAAGSDTTGISATAIVYYLIKNPHCLVKLRKELDSKTATGELSEFVTFQEGQRLPYMQAVIKETLRLHPAVGMPLFRVVPEGGASLAGQCFPEGTVVGINAWVIHRDPHIWGKDAEEFNPDRWLGSNEDVNALESKFFAFGYGARTCIGKNISLLELTKLLPGILRQFDIVPAQEGEWSTETAWFVKQKYRVKVHLREDFTEKALS
ncbi:hypothetical protein MBLNU13_g10871t2 [Cladosporium sp. NU13]